MNIKKIIFTAIFTLVGLAALQIPFTNIVGSNSHFTLFDFFAPIAGGFLAGAGVVSVFIMQFLNWLIQGAHFETAAFIRLFPVLFAVWYFSSSAKSRWIILLPALAIVMFIVHPIGRQAFLYSFYWLIPIILFFFKEKSLLAKSLGATFMAHAAGSVAWLYAFNLPKEVWLGLIPQVALERGLFALGIATTYIVFVNLLDVIERIGGLELRFIKLNRKLLLSTYLLSNK